MWKKVKAKARKREKLETHRNEKQNWVDVNNSNANDGRKHNDLFSLSQNGVYPC